MRNLFLETFWKLFPDISFWKQLLWSRLGEGIIILARIYRLFIVTTNTKSTITFRNNDDWTSPLGKRCRFNIPSSSILSIYNSTAAFIANGTVRALINFGLLFGITLTLAWTPFMVPNFSEKTFVTVSNYFWIFTQFTFSLYVLCSGNCSKIFSQFSGTNAIQLRLSSFTTLPLITYKGSLLWILFS